MQGASGKALPQIRAQGALLCQRIQQVLLRTAIGD
jgi:hypothetical protein